MILKAIIDEKTIPIEVPDYMLVEAEEFFNKIDLDMDSGWQMSRSWVDNPNNVQRCQIAADRILTSSSYSDLVKDRYKSFDSGKGQEFEQGKLSLEDLYQLAHENGEVELQSGRQERFENLINQYI